MKKLNPAAFLSYVHTDDKYGQVSTLRRARINKNNFQAIWVREGGGGTFESNDLRDNKRGA